MEGLADGKGALKFGDGRVWRERLPEVGVLGAAVGAGGEEEAGLAEGKVSEVGGVRRVGPGVSLEDEGVVAGDGGAHAGAVL